MATEVGAAASGRPAWGRPGDPHGMPASAAAAQPAPL